LPEQRGLSLGLTGTDDSWCFLQKKSCGDRHSTVQSLCVPGLASLATVYASSCQHPSLAKPCARRCGAPIRGQVPHHITEQAVDFIYRSAHLALRIENSKPPAKGRAKRGAVRPIPANRYMGNSSHPPGWLTPPKAALYFGLGLYRPGHAASTRVPLFAAVLTYKVPTRLGVLTEIFDFGNFFSRGREVL
jgi:hypothetical protein